MLERMWSNVNTHLLLVGMQTCATIQEISVNISQEIGNQSTSGSSNTTLGNIPKRAQSYYKSICSTMFVAALFVIARTWKQSRCPSTEEWIKKVLHIYTLEYQSAVKNSDILNFACKWMEIEHTMLSEITQTQKNENGMYSCISGFQP